MPGQNSMPVLHIMYWHGDLFDLFIFISNMMYLEVLRNNDKCVNSRTENTGIVRYAMYSPRISLVRLVSLSLIRFILVQNKWQERVTNFMTLQPLSLSRVFLKTTKTWLYEAWRCRLGYCWNRRKPHKLQTIVLEASCMIAHYLYCRSLSYGRTADEVYPNSHCTVHPRKQQELSAILADLPLLVRG